MRNFIFLTFLFLASTASAKIELQAFTGDGGESEYGGMEVRAGESKRDRDGGDTEVDSAVSVALAFTFPTDNGWEVGPRFGWFYMEPDSDEPEIEVNIIDAGLWLRKSLKLSGQVGGFFGVGGGASYATNEADVDDFPVLAGYGYHAIVGGGLEVELEGHRLSVGAYYTRHTFSELEGEEDGVEITMEDATVSQVMLGVGINF